MKRFKKVLLIPLIYLVCVSVNAETINIENPTQVKYAQNLNDAIDRLSEKVMSCIDAGGDMAEECMCTECSCKFQEKYNAVKKAYKEALKANPEWEDNTVFYQLEGDPMGYNVNFKGLKQQFSTNCE